MRFRRGTESAVGASPTEGVGLEAVLGLPKTAAVLPNKAGLVFSMDLLRYEARVTSVTIPIALARLQRTSRWGLKQWRLAHQIVFDPVYDWAGKLRTVNIKKQDRLFVDKDRIEYSVNMTFDTLYEKFAVNGNLTLGLRQLPADKFSSVFAKLYNDLNLAHPFREGNGRSLKTVLTAMARQAGRDFKWHKIASKKWDFDEACKCAIRGDLKALEGLFGEVTEPFLSRDVLTPRAVKRHLSTMFEQLSHPASEIQRPVVSHKSRAAVRLDI